MSKISFFMSVKKEREKLFTRFLNYKNSVQYINIHIHLIMYMNAQQYSSL